MTTIKGPDPYAIVEERLGALFAGTDDLAALYDGVCRALNEAVPTHNWVGIYLVEGADLALAAWHGPAPTEHVRIPLGQGVCGAAASSGETIVVDDVNADPRYLACFLNTRAEIVVPIKDARAVYGEIDIDSDHRGAFGPADRALLEDVAARLAARIARARAA
ncbi:MAG TPA: GAF domain-containing protein [Thermomicrobiales bacterium]|nr:GAF domain-containing protein [Thermomicrobiales bacterium]